MSKLCLKLFVYLARSDIFNRLDYRHISRATTIQIRSLHYKGPGVLCPLTIGISAVVYFFVSTGNFPCKYNNQLKLVLRIHKKINTNYVVPSAPSHFFSFSNLFAFYVGWGKGWGERKGKGNPCLMFFQSVDLVIFMQMM